MISMDMLILTKDLAEEADFPVVSLVVASLDLKIFLTPSSAVEELDKIQMHHAKEMICSIPCVLSLKKLFLVKKLKSKFLVRKSVIPVTVQVQNQEPIRKNVRIVTEKAQLMLNKIHHSDESLINAHVVTVTEPARKSKTNVRLVTEQVA